MSSEVATNTYLFEKEAYIHRISILLPRLIKRNDFLMRNYYDLGKSVQKFATGEEIYPADAFVYYLGFVEGHHITNENDIKEITSNLELCEYDVLYRFDKVLVDTLSALGEDTSVPAVQALTQLVMDQHAKDEKELLDVYLKKMAIDSVNDSRRTLKAYEKEFNDTYRQQQTIDSDTRGNVEFTNWRDIKDAIRIDGEYTRKINLYKHFVEYFSGVIHSSEDAQYVHSFWLCFIDIIEGNSKYDITGLYDQLAVIKDKYNVLLSDEAQTEIKDTLNVSIGHYASLLSNYEYKRLLLRKDFPILNVVTSENINDLYVSDDKIYDFTTKCIAKAYEAQDELEEKIKNGDANLYQLDTLVDRALSELGFDNTNSPYYMTIQRHIEDRRGTPWFMTLLNIVLTAATIACVLFSGPVGLGIALGIAGAALGGAEAVSLYQDAMFKHTALIASVGEGNQLTSATMEDIQAEFMLAGFNAFLAALDVVLTGVEVSQFIRGQMKLAKGLKNIASIDSLIPKLNPTAVQNVSRLDTEAIELISNRLGSSDNIVKFFNNVGEIPVHQVDEMNDLIKTLDDYPNIDPDFINTKTIDELLLLKREQIFSKIKGLDGADELLNGLKAVDEETVSSLSRILSKTPDNSLSNTIKNINKFNKIEDSVTIVNKFDDMEEGTRFLSWLDDRGINSLLNRSDDISHSLTRTSFYKLYKEFNNDVPAKVIKKVNMSRKVEIPDSVKLHPNKNKANDFIICKDGKSVHFNEQGFPIFESEFSVEIDPMFYKAQRESHFAICNDMLKEAIENDSALRSVFNDRELIKLSNGITPDRFVWHHSQYDGVLQLVLKKHHSIRDGGVAHLGGDKIWGIGN